MSISVAERRGQLCELVDPGSGPSDSMAIAEHTCYVRCLRKSKTPHRKLLDMEGEQTHSPRCDKHRRLGLSHRIRCLALIQDIKHRLSVYSHSSGNGKTNFRKIGASLTTMVTANESSTSYSQTTSITRSWLSELARLFELVRFPLLAQK